MTLAPGLAESPLAPPADLPEIPGQQLIRLRIAMQRQLEVVAAAQRAHRWRAYQPTSPTAQAEQEAWETLAGLCAQYRHALDQLQTSAPGDPLPA